MHVASCIALLNPLPIIATCIYKCNLSNYKLYIQYSVDYNNGKVMGA